MSSLLPSSRKDYWGGAEEARETAVRLCLDLRELKKQSKGGLTEGGRCRKKNRRRVADASPK